MDINQTMEIKIKKIPNQPTILSKISFVLGGVLIAASTLSLSIQILSTIGIVLGVLICFTISYFGFTKTARKSRTRLVTWGIFGTTVFSVVAATAFYYALFQAT
jgi:hypothetical protein